MLEVSKIRIFKFVVVIDHEMILYTVYIYTLYEINQ